MGLFDQIEKKDVLPNSTKCMTWEDVKESHERDNPKVVVRLEDIYGMVIIYMICLSAAMVALPIERLKKAQKQSNINTPSRISKQLLFQPDITNNYL